MTIEVHWDVPAERRARYADLDDARVEHTVRAALEEGGRASLAVSVVFVDDPALCELHERFLGDASPTDVISFDLGDDDEGPGGELYVSVDAPERSAEAHGLAVENELLLYVAHGTLHLCGHDDHEEEERRAMRRAELRALARVGVALDAARHEAS